MYYSATHSRPHRTVKQNRVQNYNSFLKWQNFYGFAVSKFHVSMADAVSSFMLQVSEAKAVSGFRFGA